MTLLKHNIGDHWGIIGNHWGPRVVNTLCWIRENRKDGKESKGPIDEWEILRSCRAKWLHTRVI